MWVLWKADPEARIGVPVFIWEVKGRLVGECSRDPTKGRCMIKPAATRRVELNLWEKPSTKPIPQNDPAQKSKEKRYLYTNSLVSLVEGCSLGMLIPSHLWCLGRVTFLILRHADTGSWKWAGTH